MTQIRWTKKKCNAPKIPHNFTKDFIVHLSVYLQHRHMPVCQQKNKILGEIKVCLVVIRVRRLSTFPEHIFAQKPALYKMQNSLHTYNIIFFLTAKDHFSICVPDRQTERKKQICEAKTLCSTTVKIV
jgi:hypothetical protein